MSLIICPECQHEVSSKAPTCPNCGVKIAGNIKRCPVCNTFVLMESQQCPNCKTKFVVSKTTKPNNMHTEREQKSETEEVVLVSPDDNEETTVDVQAPESETATCPDPDAVQTAEDDAGQPANGVSPVTPKGGGGSPWWLLTLGILVIAIGGFFYWEGQNQEKAEEKAFLLLENCNNPDSYEDFIARYPNSTHIDSVRARLQELQRENADWQETSSKSDVQQLEEFVKQHPNSPYKKAALQKIDTLDWKQADRKGTVAAYEGYLRRHDNGDFVDQAYAALAAARAREDLIRKDSLAAADTLKVCSNNY